LSHSQSRRVCLQLLPERHLDAIGEEGDEDVRLNAILSLMEDRPA
jgi:hypothetical protein